MVVEVIFPACFLLALLYWLVHGVVRRWPHHRLRHPARSTPSKACKDAKLFPGLTRKPHCAACEPCLSRTVSRRMPVPKPWQPCSMVWHGIVLKACGLSNVRRTWVLNKRSLNAIPGSRFRGIKPDASDHDEEQNVIRAWPNEIPRNCSGAPVNPKGGMLNGPRTEGRTRNRHGSRGGC